MNTNVHTLPVAEHPKAREAREKSAIRTFEKEKIKHAVAAHGVHFFALGRYTFCYRVDKRNVLEISSSIRTSAACRPSRASQPAIACTCACRTT